MEQTTNKMASRPIPKLMITMGIPVIMSMMLQAAYNIVDSLFVSGMNGGEAALNALTLAFPVQMLMVAVAIGTGVGVNAMLSKNLGIGDIEKVNRVTANAMFLGIAITAVYVLFGIFGAEPYIATQTENKEITDMAVSYLRICCTMSIGIVFFSLFEKLLQATGRTTLSTVAQISGAVTNIILDPILIYGRLGLPEMGIEGAAYATVIGQAVSAVTGLIFHLKFNKEIKNGIRYIKPSAKVIKGIYAIGIPAIIGQALMSVMTYALNLILGGVSENAVTAYGLYYKVQQFILFAAFGMRDVITPVVSFNYGMNNKKRVNVGIKYGMLYTVIMMAVGLLLLEVLAVPFISLFGLSGETAGMCTGAMQIVSISLIFAGINITYQGIFQALDGGVQSLVISLCRQLVFILPLAWVFSLIAKDNISMLWLVWLAFVITEAVSAVISFVLMRKVKLKNYL